MSINSRERAAPQRATHSVAERSISVEELRIRMDAARIHRGYVVSTKAGLVASHPVLEPVRSIMEESVKFAAHEAVFIGTEGGVATAFFVFVHNTTRGQAQGGVRFRGYPDLAHVLEDGLELSQAMTRKSALAGLEWGGGKAVIPLPPGVTTPAEFDERWGRRVLFEAYGRFVASLRGIYVTAEDMGTSASDMDMILSVNRFTTCVSPERGGSGDPSPITAKGVFLGMETAWEVLTNERSLEGVQVGVQGVGHVGASLVTLLCRAGARVTVSDLNPRAIAKLKELNAEIDVVPASDDSLFVRDQDILAPCATGGQLDGRRIALLKTRIVCGAANNILSDPADAQRLHERGILYIPDYVVNRMGIVNCSNEQRGYLSKEIEDALRRVAVDTRVVLTRAREWQVNPREAADMLADAALRDLSANSLRGREMLAELVSSDWAHPGGTGDDKGHIAGNAAVLEV